MHAKKATRLITVSLTLCLILVLSANAIGAQAKAITTPITYQYGPYAVVGIPVREWWNNDVYYGRRTPHAEGPVWGDLVGTTSYTGNVKLNFATWNGNGQGFQILDVEYEDLSGRFEGVIAFRITGGFLTGKTVCQGSGDSEGMKLMNTISGWLGLNFTVVGIILNPHGES